MQYLIKAFALIKTKVKNVRLIIVGDGHLKEKCEFLVERLELEDVVFAGMVKEEELPKYYSTADICCFPAIVGESFGLVLLEAMASGKPLVAFANAGYNQVLNNGIGKTVLVEPKDITGLAELLEKLISDSQLREQLGKWGLEEVKKYDSDIVGQQVLDFYIKCMENNKINHEEKKNLLNSMQKFFYGLVFPNLNFI